MSGEMVERVARAIRQEITAEGMARAAIKAMREPTDAMLRFGTNLEEGGAMLPDDWWRGMIDEALR